MKRKFKVSLIVLITIIILSPIIYGLTIFYLGFYGEHKANIEGARNIDGQIAQQKMLAELDEQSHHIIKGRECEKTRQYELAIHEYKKAIELGDDWVGHVRLADVYERTGQYDLAIKELDWLIAQKPRQEVIDEYTARKQKLEALLKK